jgi:hypothetical protein
MICIEAADTYDTLTFLYVRILMPEGRPGRLLSHLHKRRYKTQNSFAFENVMNQ